MFFDNFIFWKTLFSKNEPDILIFGQLICKNYLAISIFQTYICIPIHGCASASLCSTSEIMLTKVQQKVGGRFYLYFASKQQSIQN